MPNIGPMEIAVVLVIALLILGPKKLPSAGRGLGEGIRGFKDAITGKSADDNAVAPQMTAAASAPATTEPERQSV